jgi:integrase
MRLFLRVCLTTACRKSEALGLRWHQVDLERSVAWLHDTKNGDSRALPLVSDVKPTLANVKKVRALGGDQESIAAADHWCSRWCRLWRSNGRVAMRERDRRNLHVVADGAQAGSRSTF